MNLLKISAVVLALLIHISANANLHLAPGNFPIYSSNAVFIDIYNASYHITLDVDQKSVNVVSKIEFNMPEKGMPIFDLVPDPRNVKLNGVPVGQELIKDPENQSLLRVVKKELDAGIHVLEMENSYSRGLTFSSDSVESLFRTTDLKWDRGYWEQWVPGNYQYDQFEKTVKLEIAGLIGEQDVFTNGDMVQTHENIWVIDYPIHHNSTSSFFHTAPKGKYDIYQFTIVDPIGNTTPVTIYEENPQSGAFAKYENMVMSSFGVMSIYGAYPHPSLLIFSTQNIGMEYAGAMIADFNSNYLHEFIHSYFARGWMPADGDSSWIDEAIAMWIGNNRVLTSSPPMRASSMGNRSIYKRTTDPDAYLHGMEFIQYLDYILRKSNKKGFDYFLIHLFQNFLFKPMTVGSFQMELENYFGMSFQKEFDEYVYGVISSGSGKPGTPPTWGGSKPPTSNGGGSNGNGGEQPTDPPLFPTVLGSLK